MKSVAFVVNCLKEFDFAHLLEKYLKSERISILDHFPEAPQQFDLIVLWSYQHVVHHPEKLENVIIFHSSDLPKGRGWAPLYNMLAQKETTYTISGIKLANPVDTGDIVVKARFPILPHYTASILRQFDQELSVMLAAKILHRFEGQVITGTPQSGESSYFTRRTPAENEVDIFRSFDGLIPHLRACEPQHPAFFIYEQEKYFINIQPEREASFPENIDILYGSCLE